MRRWLAFPRPRWGHCKRPLPGERRVPRIGVEHLSKRDEGLEAIPDAEQCISYRIPAFRVDGKVVAGFAALAEHLSYFPFSGSTLAALAAELDGYARTKSALHFTPERPLPQSLLRALIAARLEEIERRGQ